MLPVRLHDTRSGELRELVPGPGGRVGIYACGPTVYNRVPHKVRKYSTHFGVL